MIDAPLLNKAPVNVESPVFGVFHLALGKFE